MSYSYMKHHYGDNCFYGDTDYKRYARYHMPRASVNIFNVGSGCCYNSHQCCGGWLSGGNFWSGLGLGFGMGLGNMFMGGLNMLGGYFGGGMNFGFPSWGISSSSSSSRSRSKSELEPQTVDGKKGDIKEDKEAKLYTEKLKEFNTLILSTPVDKDELKEFVDGINKILEETDFDGISDDLNKDWFVDLKNRAEKVLNAETPEALTEALTEAGNQVITIKIGNIAITSLDDLKKVDITDIEKLTPEDARMIALKIGAIAFDDGSTEDHKGGNNDLTASNTTSFLCGKLIDMDPKVLVLLEKAEVTTQIYKGRGNNSDNWFTGKIGDVKYDEQGKLTSFNYDCTETGEKGFKGTYTVTVQPDGSYKLEIESGSVKFSDNSTSKILKWNENTKLFDCENGLMVFSTSNT